MEEEPIDVALSAALDEETLYRLITTGGAPKITSIRRAVKKHSATLAENTDPVA